MAKQSIASVEMPESDWEATHPLLLVGKHFATKGLLIVAVWGVKHLIWRHGKKCEGVTSSVTLSSLFRLVIVGCSSLSID